MDKLLDSFSKSGKSLALRIKVGRLPPRYVVILGLRSCKTFNPHIYRQVFAWHTFSFTSRASVLHHYSSTEETKLSSFVSILGVSYDEPL